MQNQAKTGPFGKIKGLLNHFSNFLGISYKQQALIILGNAIMSFSLVNIHIQAKVTEGGGIGLALLIRVLLGVNPAIISFICDVSLYILAIFLLGGGFFKRAIYSSLSYAFIYHQFLRIGPVMPSLAGKPWLAAIMGGICIGIGCGLVVSQGAASGGDDCYSLIVEKYTPLSLSAAYFSSDFVILLLSGLIYLPWTNVFWSVLTTAISSYIIGLFDFKRPQKTKAKLA